MNDQDFVVIGEPVIVNGVMFEFMVPRDLVTVVAGDDDPMAKTMAQAVVRITRADDEGARAVPDPDDEFPTVTEPQI